MVTDETIRTAGLSSVLNPTARIVRAYSPIGTDGNAYAPSVLDFTSVATPVANERTVSDALGTTAPDGSRTTPTTAPTFCWALDTVSPIERMRNSPASQPLTPRCSFIR